MVFSSIPAYLDPSNWQPQRPSEHGSEPEDNQIPPPLLLPPLPTTGGGGSTSKPFSMTDRARLAKLPLPEVALKCPRCESNNTKFCYFNNYNLAQPRHFCKTCRRYWTRGGALRNVPVGGGCRKNNKRSKGGNRSKSPATNSPIGSMGSSRCTTDNINHSALPVPPKLPFYPSMHQLADYGAGTSLGITFGNIQTSVAAAGNDIDMINIGSNSQWRMSQMQPPFSFSQGSTAGMYQFESNGASDYVNAATDYVGCKTIDSRVTQVDGVINMEENPQGINLSPEGKYGYFWKY